jgi:RNA polymerase sigma-70 factor (ECF subfamily)
MSDQPSAEEFLSQLLRRIAARDRHALAEFYDQVARMLFSVSVRILSDPHEAEEVIQDVFVQIWEKAPAFDPAIGAALHWAIAITRNRSIDRLRAGQRRARLQTELNESIQIPPASADSFAPVGLDADEIAAIRTAVKELPGDQRQAIELAFFGGLTHLEIAASLNEPLGTIKARIRRGMLKLRENLKVCV